MPLTLHISWSYPRLDHVVPWYFANVHFYLSFCSLLYPVLGTYPFTESGAVGAESTATKASGRATERASLQAGSRQTTTFPSTHVVSSEHMKSFTFLCIIWSTIWTTNEFCSFVCNPSINFEKVEKTVYYLDVKTGIFVIFGHMWAKYRKCSRFEVLCSWGKGVPKSCHSATFCIMFTFCGTHVLIALSRYFGYS